MPELSHPLAKVHLDLLTALTEATNGHDIEAVMALFADDCVYYASFGTEDDGTTYTGQSAVRAAFTAGFASHLDGRYDDVSYLVDGERAALQWTFCGTSEGTGERVVIRGCDLITFASSKIAVKDAFRKQKFSAQDGDVS